MCIGHERELTLFFCFRQVHKQERGGFFLLSFWRRSFKVIGCPRTKDKRRYSEGLVYPPGFVAVLLLSWARGI